jgi:hypothetical protein
VTLERIAAEGLKVPYAHLGALTELCLQLQSRLATAGVLDPPADGRFGPVSLWALGEFLERCGLPASNVLGPEAALALLDAALLSRFPLRRTDTLAGRIAAALVNRGDWICRHPACVNIVYVEGMNPDGSLNDDAPNAFNDLRLILRIADDGEPRIEESWEATSEPGHRFTVIQKLDPRGAARVAFGQYKAWSVGTHNASKPSGHEALVQTAPVRVYRDLNEDFERDGDALFEGLFGINQHWGYDLPRNDIGPASAGCLVGRFKDGHRKFMKLCKADPRFKVSNGYRFLTSVIPAAAIAPGPQ